MEKTFNPKEIEARWYSQWETSAQFEPKGSGQPYCILLPPPNVTGTLHMGHAFQQTIMDTLSRYHRMQGRCTLWQGGTDHAGIATQKIVENQLATQNLTRHDLGREKFLDKVWAWKEQSGSTITQQMRRLGASVDWSRERFTMDDGLSAAVRKVFIQWYRDGLIYRGKRLVHWDPVLQTAVSDLEVNNEERDGSLWLIRYPATNGDEGLVVATTRPETMLGDVAVAVHPEDERYAHLIGQTLLLPLTERKIPVIADTYVDRNFGTGCVKITPAHDFNDWQIGTRHQLDPINIFTLDGKCNENVPFAYQKLDRFEARKQVLRDLDAQQLLIETKKHKLQVPISQRSDAIIEPMLTDQWFVDLTRDVLDDGRPGGRQAITQPALEAVTSGAIRFVPDNWSTTYQQWLDNIQDWCISRQLWWGHRIPAWYDESGQIFVGETPEEAIDWSLKHKGPTPVGALKQDADVLDTWFSSALWPFSTLGWPGDTPERATEWQHFEKFLPSAVLVTGFDIIFFWVARMVMATVYFVGRQADGSYQPQRSKLADRIPFHEVYINAIVRDAEGHKMSKSKGNTIDPLDLIDGITLDALVHKSTSSLLIPQIREKVEKRIRKDYPQGIPAVGSDAMRFTFAALATYGRTINFDLKRCEGYKNFCNKLWNAARYVHMNCDSFHATNSTLLTANTEPERWILSRLAQTLDEVEHQFSLYRFDLVAQALYDFTWNDYCDWFIELSKPALTSDDPIAVQSTRHTLLYVLETLLRALHPIIPFITEEIWQSIAPKLEITDSFVGNRPYPKSNTLPITIDQKAIDDIQWLITVVNSLRRIRSEMNIAPSKRVPLFWSSTQSLDAQRMDQFASTIAFLARSEPPILLSENEAEPASASAIAGELRLLIPLAGLIDLDAEKNRLHKEIARLESEIQKCVTKLANPNFSAHAPPAVVEQEHLRITEFEKTLLGLRDQAEKLVAH
jgi:valyl-tRNA synthetase